MGSNDILRDFSQKKFLTKNIASRVTRGLETFDDALRLRRKKLKLMIDEEDNELYRELHLHEKLKIDLIIQMQKDAVENVEKQKAKEKEELMARKRLQLDMSKCKDIQPLLRRRREMETQQVQQQQIKEIAEKHNQEREINNMWFHIMKNDSEAKREKEEQEINERLKSNMEQSKILAAQIQIAKEAQRKKEREEKEHFDTFMVLAKRNTERSICEETLKTKEAKALLGESLKNQITSRAENIKRQKEKEQALESSFAKMCTIQHEEEEKKKLENKVKQKQQLEMYGQHATAIKAEREAREKAEDLMVAEIGRKRLEESEKQRIMLARKSQVLLKEALVGRDVQMEAKKKEAEAAAQKIADEMEARIQKEKLIIEQRKQDKERETKAKIAYKQYLEEQMELSKNAKEKEKAKLISDFNNKLIEEKEFNEQMVQLLKREIGSEGVHPFKKAMNEKSNTKKSFCQSVPETAYLKY